MKLNLDLSSKIDIKPQSKNPFLLDNDENLLCGLIGTNRTGKSSVARKIAEDWRKTFPNEKTHRIMSFDPQKRFSSISTDFIFSNDKEWVKKALKLKNSLLILDDYRLIHKRARSMEEFDELMYFRAENNVDIIYICHNPALVINALTYFTNIYCIFFTNAQEGGFEKKIPNYVLCEQASAFINDYVKYFDRGFYDKVKNYPNFPHVVINTLKQQLFGMNVDTDAYRKIKSKIQTQSTNYKI